MTKKESLDLGEQILLMRSSIDKMVEIHLKVRECLDKMFDICYHAYLKDNS